MITIRTFAEITADRQVAVSLPPETPIGRAELVVTIASQAQASAPSGAVRGRFGTVHSCDAHAADNERIDADLVRTYENPQE